MIFVGRESLVYAFEGTDNSGSAMEIVVPPRCEFTSLHIPELLNGVTVIRLDKFQAIPYYLWANRGSSDMRVWLPAGGQQDPGPGPYRENDQIFQINDLKLQMMTPVCNYKNIIAMPGIIFLL